MRQYVVTDTKEELKLVMMEIITVETGKTLLIYHNRCNSDCSAKEKGYACPTVGAACYIVCGDGYYQSGEGCDDNNLKNNDGCSNTCGIETGWDCKRTVTHGMDTCKSVCGDGLYKGNEVCDDGNYHSGDG